MKDAYEVLQQKEADLARTQHEIDCLRITARSHCMRKRMRSGRALAKLAS
jgi:hypothetical protein